MSRDSAYNYVTIVCPKCLTRLKLTISGELIVYEVQGGEDHGGGATDTLSHNSRLKRRQKPLSEKMEIKTLNELIGENVGEWKTWVTSGITEKQSKELAPKYYGKWVSVESLKQWLEGNAKIECFQCEKCGFIDASARGEFEAMPKEHQRFLLEHREKCGGRFLPFRVVALKELLDLLEKNGEAEACK